MNVFVKALAIALLASVTGLSGCTNSIQGEPPKEISSSENESITVALPTLINVVLKEGESKSGQLIEIDPKEQKLTLALDDESDSVALSQIEKVTFNGEVPLIGRGDRLRGKNEIWYVKPLSDFKIQDASTGQAEVRRASVSVVKKEEPADFWGEPSSYVLEEMRFESPETITLKVTPVVQ